MSESGSSGSTSGSVEPPSVPHRPSPLRASVVIGTPILRRLPMLPLLFIGTRDELLRAWPPTLLNTGVGLGWASPSSSFDSLSPTFEGREPNVREDGAATSVVTGGVALRKAGEDARRDALDLVLAGRSGWNTGGGSAGAGVSVRLCLRCDAGFGLTSGLRGDTFQSSSVHGAICWPTSSAALESVCDVFAVNLGGTADDCDLA